MADMLVKLYELPSVAAELSALASEGIEFRPALVPEKTVLRSWVLEHFSQNWADEVEAAVLRQPSCCIVATKDQQIAGFAAVEATAPNYFGPTGVHPDFRGQGIGKVLLVQGLELLRSLGYAYAIIGGVGPAGFYRKAVGAIEIADSSPGIYKGLLKADSAQ